MLFTFQYVPICFYYFSFYDTITDFVSKIYIPICFYYFKKSTIESISYSNLHSNMFLLFLESSQSKRFVKFIYIPICFYYFLPVFLSIQEWDKFTFQYVSIISEQTRKLNTEHFLFTFQYVSIISGNRNSGDCNSGDIYIPICFYYFCCSL